MKILFSVFFICLIAYTLQAKSTPSWCENYVDSTNIPSKDVKAAVRMCEELEQQSKKMQYSIESFVKKYTLREASAKKMAEQFRILTPAVKENIKDFKPCSTKSCLQKRSQEKQAKKEEKKETQKYEPCDKKCQEKKENLERLEKQGKKIMEKNDIPKSPAPSKKLPAKKFDSANCGFMRDVELDGKNYQVRACLKSGEMLAPGQGLVSENGNLFFVFQKDGNAVVYETEKKRYGGGVVEGKYTAIWASNTWNVRSTHMILQTDGNLVIYNYATPVWSNNGWRNGKREFLKLFLKNNGILETENSMAQTVHRFGTPSRYWF